MDDTNGSLIVEKLDTLIRLTAIGLCEGKTQKEQIALLSSAGLQPKAIANLLDTTPNNVSVALSHMRKARARKRQSW